MERWYVPVSFPWATMLPLMAARSSSAVAPGASVICFDTAETVKTSLKLDRTLWKRAHLRAMDDGVDLQTVVGRALEAYLKGGAK